MAAVSVPSEIIEKERKKLLDLLQQDPDSILDALNSRRLISEEEYEALEDITDPLKKSRKLLILVQKKGEVSCLDFLKCLFSTFPESATTWNLRHGKFNFYTFLRVRGQYCDKRNDLQTIISFIFLLEIIFTEI